MLKRFIRNEQGNFAVMTAVLATVLVGGMVGIIDLSRQWSDRSMVQRAADAAALAGAREMETGTRESAERVIQEVAKANLGDRLKDVTFVSRIDEQAGTVRVSGSGGISPTYLPVFGSDRLDVGTSSTAAIQRKVYTDYYLLLDVSESMNIAASEDERVRLERISTAFMRNRIDQSCAFACHSKLATKARRDVERTLRDEYERLAGRTYNGEALSIFDLSQIFGVRLRIDVLKDATSGLIDKMLAVNGDPHTLRFNRIATAGFNSTFDPGLSPTVDGAALKASIRGFVRPESEHTDMRRALREFARLLGRQGDGRSASTPRKVAILVTDGVRDDDRAFRRSGLGPVETNHCAAIKQGKDEHDNDIVPLAVLDVKYLNRSGERFFDERVAWYFNDISANLRHCASPGLYYLATDSDQARDQLLQMAGRLMSTRMRLIN